WTGRYGASCQAPADLAVREERAGAGGLLHADPLRGALEFVLAPVRAEEVAALLVFAARYAFAALDPRAADGVVRLARDLPLARIHRRPPSAPLSGFATGLPPRPGAEARCAIGFLPWVRVFLPRVAARSRPVSVRTTLGAWPVRAGVASRPSEKICAGRILAACGAFSS